MQHDDGRVATFSGVGGCKAGAAATLTGTQTGAAAINAAAQAGTVGTMVAGSVGLIVGVFLRHALSRAQKP